MVVAVASKVGKSVSQSLGGLSLASGGMLLRLRRTSIALLALVGAVGLGLIVFISQLGWPAVLTGPIPSAPQKVTVERGVALTQPAAVGAGTAAAGDGGTAGARTRQGENRADRGAAGESNLAGSRGLTAAADTQPGAGSGQPAVAQPAPQPTTQPSPTTSPPAATIPAAAGNQSSTAAGNAKAASDGARSAELAAAKQQGPKTAAKDPASAGGSKSADLASVKAQHDGSTAADPAPPTAPPAPAANPAAAKEAADAAR